MIHFTLIYISFKFIDWPRWLGLDIYYNFMFWKFRNQIHTGIWAVLLAEDSASIDFLIHGFENISTASAHGGKSGGFIVDDFPHSGISLSL